MATDETKLAILKAAELLYARRGFFDFQLRDIVAEAGVSLNAVNYHFGSKDELLRHLFLLRTSAMNQERLLRLEEAELAGGGRASVEDILEALVEAPLRWCLGADSQQSAAARFVMRALVESAPPIRKILDRDVGHLSRFAAALSRSRPDQSERDIYWGLHFTVAMVRQTINDRERLNRLSGGACRVDDLSEVVGRIIELALPAFNRKQANRQVRGRTSTGKRLSAK
jgi:AcrR family transcriptional regulator